MFKRKLLGMVLLASLLFGQSVPRAQAAMTAGMPTKSTTPTLKMIRLMQHQG